MTFKMTDNTFINVVISILNDLKRWGLALMAPLACVVIVIEVIKYKRGNEVERNECKKRIRNTIIIAGGVYGLLWFVSYVMTKMAAANI